MTDTTPTSLTTQGLHTSTAAEVRLRRRYAAERRFRLYGIAAIVVALGVLAVLLFTIVSQGYTAFVNTEIELEVYVDPADFPIGGQTPTPEEIREGNYRNLLSTALQNSLPGAESPAAARDLRNTLSGQAYRTLRDRLLAEPSLIGQRVSMSFLADSDIDQAFKGNTPRDVPEERRRVSNLQYEWIDYLEQQGRISTSFNSNLFTEADSRQPEQAGLWGAIVGSFYLMLVTAVLSIPVGVGAAIYLEEFAPKNRFTSFIEININNLAAVPSIIFGLLGLAVFIQVFGLPRSAPLVGGLALTLMTLPTIIISSRASLRAIPPSIREAAYGLGASKMQVVVHHVLPLAVPGILTGSIIGLAQALGETAPLLMIGMNAFITSAPDSMFSPATALPSQIYIWADSSERGFVERTSAGIMVLLGFLILMNATAIFLRKRFEKRW